ncbi:MAG: hypothetical protein ACRDK0_09795 [Solirubrobacteraceae bacterium]
MTRLRIPLLAFSLLLAAAGPAGAMVELPELPRPVAGNPADRLLSMPIEDSAYDPASRCTPKAKPGMLALQRWLEANVRGVFWGSYRCEKWGKRQASLHSENRALDWHLDVSASADRRAAERLIRLLLAPDTAGNAQALARRMGVDELIWDCGYWGAGMTQFSRYRPCYSKRGKLRRKLDRTVAHRDHLHIGMTKAGAKGRTSFWSTGR